MPAFPINQLDWRELLFAFHSLEKKSCWDDWQEHQQRTSYYALQIITKGIGLLSIEQELHYGLLKRQIRFQELEVLGLLLLINYSPHANHVYHPDHHWTLDGSIALEWQLEGMVSLLQGEGKRNRE